MEYITLKGGKNMPVIGIGTWRLKGNAAVKTVGSAIKLGYTRIDTAEIYGNEKEIGSVKMHLAIFLQCKVFFIT